MCEIFELRILRPHEVDAKGSMEVKIDGMRAVVKSAGGVTPEPCSLSLSVGVATYPEDGADAEELLAEADRRMYKSKRMRKKSSVIAIESFPREGGRPSEGSGPSGASREEPPQLTVVAS